MMANKTLLHMKYARIIEAFAKKCNLSSAEAMDFFYHSLEYKLIREGVSDLHCMSEDYLAEELKDELSMLKKK